MGGEVQCPYCGQSVSRAEYRKIVDRISSEERARIAKIEQTLKERFAREGAQAQAKARAEIERVKRDAAKSAEARIRVLRASVNETVSQRLAAQREVLTRQAAEALNVEKGKYFAEKLSLEQQLEEMKRRLQRRTSNDLGEEGEVNLFDTLVAAFPDDLVTRVRRGQKGPDVVIKVVNAGAIAGKIVLDAKNHKRWSHSFTSKLRADQLAEGGEFAILCTSVMPAGAQQLHVQDNVIVASPARVVALVTLLRRVLVQNHLRRLSDEDRSEKAQELYTFLVSEKGRDLFQRLHRFTDDLIDLEVKEVDAHHGTWRRRGELLRGVQAVHEDFTSALDAIISGTVREPQEAAA